jgi:ribosomal protein S18 acetylase RimI-like enzyme
VSAQAWHRAVYAAVCDVIEPWAHGTVARATRYPTYWAFNLVRVEEDPGMTAGELAAFADEALAGLEHRWVALEYGEGSEELRPEFQGLGWETERLVWMRHEADAQPGSDLAVEEVDYGAVEELRVLGHHEDFPDVELRGFLAVEREVAELLGARVLAVRESGAPVAFAELQNIGGSAEIARVYVHPDHRGRGLGTAVTSAAIAAAGDADDLWIVADDEGRAKDLYARLGFTPKWTAIQALRLP